MQSVLYVRGEFAWQSTEKCRVGKVVADDVFPTTSVGYFYVGRSVTLLHFKLSIPNNYGGVAKLTWQLKRFVCYLCLLFCSFTLLQGEEGNWNVCRNVGQLSRSDTARRRKPKLHIELQPRKRKDKKYVHIYLLLTALVQRVQFRPTAGAACQGVTHVSCLIFSCWTSRYHRDGWHSLRGLYKGRELRNAIRLYWRREIFETSVAITRFNVSMNFVVINVSSLAACTREICET
jgi:hypothetical protein